MTETERTLASRVAGPEPASYPPGKAEGAQVPRRDIEAKGYLNPEELGELLGLSRRTIYRRIQDGTLPARKVGGVWRIQRQDLDRALAAEPTPKRPGRGK